MATHNGTGGSVKIGANAVAKVLQWELTEGVKVANNNAMGDASESHLSGTKNWNGSINCYWDETDSTGQEAMTIGASVDLHLLPDGAVAGDIDFNGTATITSISRSSQNDEIVTANFSFQGNGDLTRDVLV